MLPNVIKHHRVVFVVVHVSAQKPAKLWLAYPAPAMAHDEQSLAAIATKAAVDSRARVHELLGRNDVQVSCVCPTRVVCVRAYDCVCLSVRAFRICSFELLISALGITGLQKYAVG
jgi:hypothetical protein